MLYHDIENPGSLPLFRVAIFICGDLPFTRTPDQGADVTDEYVRDGILHGDVINDAASLAELKKTTAGRSALKLGVNATNTPADEDGASPFEVRRFMPSVDRERIRTPTVHVYGAQDKDLHKSLALVEMCDEKFRWCYQHQGGHEIPNSGEVQKRIVEIVHAATVRSEIMY